MKLTIKAARVNKGMTQSEAASAMRMSVGTYQKIEANPGRTTRDQALELARIFSVPFDFLFFADDSTLPVDETAKEAARV